MLLELINIKGGYTAGNNIIKGLNLSIDHGDTIGIVGQNGAGKSTIAKIIMNIVPYISGEILYNGKSVSHIPTHELADLGIGFFFQGGMIFPNLTVAENISCAGSKLKKTIFEERKQKLESYFPFLQNFSTGQRTNLYASYLSGGEKHQLALAMVLINNPNLLILDEPSAGLSPGNTKILYDTLLRIKENERLSILLIEQNVQFAFDFSDHVVLIQHGIIKHNNITKKELETAYFEIHN